MGQIKIHNPIFKRFCMIHPSGPFDRKTDRQTDGWAIAYSLAR